MDKATKRLWGGEKAPSGKAPYGNRKLRAQNPESKPKMQNPNSKTHNPKPQSLQACCPCAYQEASQNPKTPLKIQNRRTRAATPRFGVVYLHSLQHAQSRAPAPLEGVGAPRSTVARSAARCVDCGYARRRQIRCPRLPTFG